MIEHPIPLYNILCTFETSKPILSVIKYNYACVVNKLGRSQRESEIRVQFISVAQNYTR